MIKCPNDFSDKERIKWHKDNDSIKFKLHTCYSDKEDVDATRQKRCSECGHNIFYVGQGSYFTVVRCLKCKTEECIHDG